jgi:pSer/pThr/pTyr-binding forkhead associated (FHA) protein
MVDDPALSESEVEDSAPADQAVAEAPTGKTGTDAGPRARLILKQAGTETDKIFEFSPPATVGRFDPAVGQIDVDLGNLEEAKFVSRKHAEITCEDGVWKIKDLASSNGTFVLRGDFERVDEAELADGTEIAFGNARFVFRLADAQSEPDEPEVA